MALSLSFESWMQQALYGPEGYYSRHIRSVGRRGDFSTSATLIPDLGRAVAYWAKRRARELDMGFQWHLIEVGAGDGSFARLVLESLGWWVRHVVHYHIVEVSGPLRELQEEKLRSFPVQWHERLDETLQQCAGDALIFSNELVDAFPCVLASWNGSAWEEIHLRQEMAWEETTVPLSGTERHGFVSSALQRQNWPVGQRVEIHWSYADWCRQWTPYWKKGSLLTIDYGQPMESLYHRRPSGSLRAFWQHQRFEGHDIYSRQGRQDLTADVNFTDLVNWGKMLQWKNREILTQNQFLQEYTQANPSADPWGAGEAFLVLEQQPPGLT